MKTDEPSSPWNLEGTTLESFLDDTHTPLAVGKILNISLDVINGLEAAHARGIIHRDIKPTNIFVTSRAAKILDFGLAKFTATQASAEDATKMEGPISTSGEALGTAAYMSPERAATPEPIPNSMANGIGDGFGRHGQS